METKVGDGQFYASVSKQFEKRMSHVTHTGEQSESVKVSALLSSSSSTWAKSLPPLPLHKMLADPAGTGTIPSWECREP